MRISNVIRTLFIVLVQIILIDNYAVSAELQRTINPQFLVTNGQTEFDHAKIQTKRNIIGGSTDKGNVLFKETVEMLPSETLPKNKTEEKSGLTNWASYVWDKVKPSTNNKNPSTNNKNTVQSISKNCKEDKKGPDSDQHTMKENLKVKVKVKTKQHSLLKLHSHKLLLVVGFVLILMLIKFLIGIFSGSHSKLFIHPKGKSIIPKFLMVIPIFLLSVLLIKFLFLFKRWRKSIIPKILLFIPLLGLLMLPLLKFLLKLFKKGKSLVKLGNDTKKASKLSCFLNFFKPKKEHDLVNKATGSIKDVIKSKIKSIIPKILLFIPLLGLLLLPLLKFLLKLFKKGKALVKPGNDTKKASKLTSFLNFFKPKKEHNLIDKVKDLIKPKKNSIIPKILLFIPILALLMLPLLKFLLKLFKKVKSLVKPGKDTKKVSKLSSFLNFFKPKKEHNLINKATGSIKDVIKSKIKSIIPKILLFIPILALLLLPLLKFLLKLFKKGKSLVKFGNDTKKSSKLSSFLNFFKPKKEHVCPCVCDKKHN